MWGGFLNSLYTNIFIKGDGKWGVAYFFNPGTDLPPPSASDVWLLFLSAIIYN